MNDRVLVSKKLFIVNSVSSFITRLLGVTVLIWVQQYLLKRISVEEYSLIPIIYSLMIMVAFFSWVLTSGISRYVLEAYANNKNDQITKIVSSIFPILCLVGLLLVVFSGVVTWKIDKVFQIDPEFVDDAQIMFMLIISLEILRLPMAAFSSGLYVHQRLVLENLIKISCESLRFVLLFILLLGVSVSVISVVAATVVAGFVEILVLYTVSRRLLPSQRFDRSKFDLSIVKELSGFGGWSSICGLSGMIRKSADVIILNRLSTPLDVTYFHLGTLIPNRLESIVNQSFVGPASPILVGLHTTGQDEKLKRTYLRLGRFAMWGMLLIIAPFMVHYEQIVTLYVGKTFLSAGTVMFLLLACYPVVYGNILYTSLAVAKVCMRPLAIRESASAVANLLLTLLLVGHYQLGAIGAATATFIVYGLGSILLFWPFGKGMVSASWREIWGEIVLPGITPFLAALLTMKLLAVLSPVGSWSAIALNAMLGASVHLAVLWVVAKEVDKAQFYDTLTRFVSRKSND